MTQRTVRVVNPLGLHARAAARFVAVAGRHASRIEVQRGVTIVNGKSILGLLLLAAARGTELVVSADGPDEVQALLSLIDLVDRGFEEA